MTRLGLVFWSVAGIEAALLAVFCVVALADRGGQHDGGRAMGLFFYVLLPALVLAAAMALFHFSAAWPVRALALLIVAAPALWFAQGQVGGWLVERRVEANRQGTGYFAGAAMQQLGAAVVQRDVATLLRIGPSVDINTPGRGMTLLRLAVEGPDARISDGSELPVVRALLALGAHADDALPIACVRFDPALLTLLLAAGADPNLQLAPQQPLVFQVMGSLTLANFRLLVGHGLDLDSRDGGNPLPVQLVIHRRWDLLVLAIQGGADMERARPDGRTVASELADQSAQEIAAGRAPPAELLRAVRLLDAARARR